MTWSQHIRDVDAEFRYLRMMANDVACPQPPKGCGVAKGEVCRNVLTGEELAKLPAHGPRMAAAADALEQRGGVA